MKHFIKTGVALAALCATFVTAPLFAQEWSDAQKEVWKNVEAYWALWAQRDLEGFLDYSHSDFSGWRYGSPLPNNKASARKWLTHFFEIRKILVYEVNPVAIQIHGNFAFVHYYYDHRYKDVEAKEKSAQGRWTDILMKQGKKWVVIGDHGGPTSND